MRRALLLAVLGLGTLAEGAVAAGYPYTESTDSYTLSPAVTPYQSGTVDDPLPADVAFSYTVDTDPSGNRPGLTKGFKLAFQGIGENSVYFPACSTSQLARSGPAGCPKGSRVGGGYITFEEGPSDATSTDSDGYCTVDTTLFDGGRHHLSLYIVEGPGEGDNLPCVLPSHAPLIVDVKLAHTSLGGVPGLLWEYSLPGAVLHPAADTDAAIVADQWEVPLATTTVSRVKALEVKVTRIRYVYRYREVVEFVGQGAGRHRARVRVRYRARVKVTRTVTKHIRTTSHVGFLTSDYCSPNGQRLISAGFTDEDGTGRVRRATVPCTR